MGKAVFEMKRIYILLGLIIMLLIANTYLRPDLSGILKNGRADFDKGKYSLAKGKFKKVVEQSEASSGIRCEAQIFYATCFVREGKLEDGKKQLEKFIQEYPTSFWTPQAYFDLAYCAAGLGNKKRARQIYQKIINDYATTTWAGYSKQKIMELDR